MSKPQYMVLFIFGWVVLLWTTGQYWLKGVFPDISDAWISIAGAALLFVVLVSGNKSLIEWKDVSQIPWDVLLLFGGGLALAQGFKVSGLNEWMGTQLKDLLHFQLFFIV